MTTSPLPCRPSRAPWHTFQATCCTRCACEDPALHLRLGIGSAHGFLVVAERLIERSHHIALVWVVAHSATMDRAAASSTESDCRST